MGDFVFSALAAGLAFALLIATARHLFSSPSAAALDSQPAAAVVTPALTVPVRPAAPTAIRVAPVARVRKVAPVAKVARDVPVGKATRVAPVADVAHVASHSKVVRAATVFKVAHVASVTEVEHIPPVSKRARVAPSLVGSAWRAGGRKAVTPASTVARSVVGLRLPERVSSSSRARPGRPNRKLILEPPLGYEAAPTLSVLPAAADIDFASVTPPAIRAQRRH